MTLFKSKKKTEPEELLQIDTTGLSEEEIARLQAEAVLEKYDKESSYRTKLPRGLSVMISAILIMFSLFQLFTAIFAVVPTQMLRSIHLSFAILLVFLLYPAKKGGRKDIIPWYDWILAVVATGATMYITFDYNYLVNNIGNYSSVQFIIAIIGILGVMEACRRVVGVPILIVASVFILYALMGPYMPGFLWHGGYSIERVANHLFFTTSGVFGTPIGVSSTFIFLFILFGAFLEKTGVGKLFIDLANSIAGRFAGGPAKVAVISSALQGTVSGSSVANTVSTGSFTIPAMLKLGYKPEFAGAVEASASTGGQLMPPIMGAAAFLMAETIGIPYAAVVKAAIIPAILYFSGILISVHLEAKKIGLKGMDVKDIPKAGIVFRERGHLLIPLIIMIYMLIVGYTATYAALSAILFSLTAYSIGVWALIPGVAFVVALIMGVQFFPSVAMAGILWLVICAFRRKIGLTIGDILTALETGARNILGVAIACAVAGIIVGIVTLTGLGLNLANGLKGLAGDNVLLMLFFTMVASIILGMGVPTTANYLITSTICAGALVAMGIPVIAAHLFVFYFGIVADITPPVALAAMAGSAIAKGDPFKTGVTATRIAIGAFIVPYIFAFNQQMLMMDVTFFGIIQIVITSLLGMYAVSGGLTGYVQDKCMWYERILFVVGGLCMIDPGWFTDLIGLVIIGILCAKQIYFRKKREGALSAV
ncbi:MAG: TRAP transporter permease [Hydrogenoanaerobacterium sp.]